VKSETGARRQETKEKGDKGEGRNGRKTFLTKLN
jgi:hypothetical protein